MKKLTKLIVINLGVFVLIILSIEIFGNITYYLFNGQFIFEKDKFFRVNQKIFEGHPYLVGWPRENITYKYDGKEITTTCYHSRFTGATGKREEKTTIVLIGGSTTFGVKISDSETWAYILQKKLGPDFYVINLGVPGYSTVEAIIQLSLIVPEFNPDIIIHYHGWNDIHNYHDVEFTSDYKSHGLKQYHNLGLISPIFPRDYSFLFLLANKVKSIIKKIPNDLIKDYDQPDKLVDDLYERNLRTIILLSEKLSNRVYFLPQILNEEKYASSKENDYWSPNIKESAMPKLIHNFNNILKRTIKDNSLKSVFIEELLKQPWHSEDFVDRGHFSALGGEKFASVITQLILNDLTHLKSKENINLTAH